MQSNQRIKLANRSDIPEGKSVIVKLNDEFDREVALFNLNGEIFALNNLCPHMDGPLGDGEIADGVVTCPWHGWQFDIRSGSCINMPGDDAKKINLVIEGDEIFLLNTSKNSNSA